MRTATRALALGVAAAVTLAACIPRPADQPLDLGVPGDLKDVVAEIEYYPACGNETLEYEGRTYYPYRPANADEMPRVVPSGSAGMAVRPLPAVAAPELGDDVGTLWVYEDGFAWWGSDSGDLDTWLTTKELTYNWVC